MKAVRRLPGVAAPLDRPQGCATKALAPSAASRSSGPAGGIPVSRRSPARPATPIAGPTNGKTARMSGISAACGAIRRASPAPAASAAKDSAAVRSGSPGIASSASTMAPASGPSTRSRRSSSVRRSRQPAVPAIPPGETRAAAASCPGPEASVDLTPRP